MFDRLGAFVSHHWLLVILFWVVLVVVVLLTSPAWDSVTHDGDLAYMPAYMPSMQGERLLQRAFPDGISKSDAVVILARDDRPLDVNDLIIVKSLVGRLLNLHGTSALQQSERFREEAKRLRENAQADQAVNLEAKADELGAVATQAFEESVNRFQSAAEQHSEGLARDPYYANPAHNLALIYEREGSSQQAEQLRAVAWDLSPELKAIPRQLAGNQGLFPIIDVWSRYTEQFGNSLVSKDNRADLIFLRLSNEFMAQENIPLIKDIEQLLDVSRATLKDWPAGLEVSLSGSAAVGSDILRSSAESIANTELYTVILVVTILLFVYRSPVLVVVPLISIVVSLIVATGIVAQLATLDQYAGMEWWEFKIFTTTKIFVVVILFGAGTDYCLFLIARYREELDSGKDISQAVAASLGGVGAALAASAFTTILGLGTMYWAEFGKFRNSGPTIGLCLLVTLFACMTLAPALLRAMGNSIHWTIELGNRPKGGQRRRGRTRTANGTLLQRFWHGVADQIVGRPVPILVGAIALLLPFFLLGFDVAVTYDLISELDASRISKQGVALLRRHFPVGESGPVTVLAQKPGANFDSDAGTEAIRELTRTLYEVQGVQSVRSLTEPTGELPRSRPGNLGLVKERYPLVRQLYLSKQTPAEGDVTRLELILVHDPFSKEATRVLQDVDGKLANLGSNLDSYWSDCRFVFTGTTAAIRDLRAVTSTDNVRIQILVVLAVLIILLLLLRRPAVCIYLILSVLFSYYVTIGATQLCFQYIYGDTFEGLDWKVPLFLFVILVAIGQDYNIYLAARVFEEQREHGLFGGLRVAIVRTGGIITSCGVIMAGTFLSMVSGSMRGIVELGFALTLGVLLDTFVVRPILVPAFLSILFRWHSRHKIDVKSIPS